MKIIWFIVAVLALVYAVNGKPTSDDDYLEYEEQMLKDTEDEEYENTEDDNDDAPDDTPPSLVTKPGEYFAKTNETLSLPCEVLHGENYVLMWKKNESLLFQDMILFGGDRHKYERLKNGTLIIKNTNPEDTGEYICSILLKNQQGIQVMHHVYVETAAKIIALSTPNNLKELKIGDSLILICKTTGIPKPKINWYFKDNLLLRHSDETLEIDNVDYKNMGQYRCFADNKVGVDHKSISVTFQHKPVITIKELRSNETIQELHCETEANPPVSLLQWKFNGTVIEDQNAVARHKNNVLKLIFENFDESDFGKYTCIAKNRLGKTEQTIRVDLLPKKPLLVSILPTPKHVEITWSVLSTPPLTDNVVEYKLEKDDVWKTEKAEIISLKNGVYTVGLNFTDLHHGKYVAKLISFNAYGASEPSLEEQLTIKRHSKHQHPENSHISFGEDVSMADTRNSQAVPPNDSVLNDQEDTAQTGSQISSGVLNAVPSLLIFLLGFFMLLQ